MEKKSRGGKNIKKRRYSISKMGLELKCNNKYWFWRPYAMKINNRPIHIKPVLILHKKCHGKYILEHWKNVRRTEATRKRQQNYNVSKNQSPISK